MKSAARPVVATLMAIVGLMFAAITIGLTSLFFSPDVVRTKEKLTLAGGLLFLATLAYISLVFSWRCARGHTTAAGTYVSPWAVGFIGVVMLCGSIVRGMSDGNWKPVLQALPISAMMVAFAVVAWRKKSKPNRSSQTEENAHDHTRHP